MTTIVAEPALNRFDYLYNQQQHQFLHLLYLKMIALLKHKFFSDRLCIYLSS